MAYIVGVMLLILVAGMIAKYAFDQSVVVEVAGPIHGFLYVLYLLTVIDLALKAKFSVVRTLLVMLTRHHPAAVVRRRALRGPGSSRRAPGTRPRIDSTACQTPSCSSPHRAASAGFDRC